MSMSADEIADRPLINRMQPSYAQDMGVGGIQHGFYGSMMNGLGSLVGTIGMIPCCPAPNPFKDVRKYFFDQQPKNMADEKNKDRSV